MACKDVEQGKGADHIVGFIEQQLVTQPAVINDSRIFVLHQFGHAGGATGVKVGANPVFGRIFKCQHLGLRRDGLLKILHARLMLFLNLGPDQRDNPAFGRFEIP